MISPAILNELMARSEDELQLFHRMDAVGGDGRCVWARWPWHTGCRALQEMLERDKALWHDQRRCTRLIARSELPDYLVVRRFGDAGGLVLGRLEKFNRTVARLGGRQSPAKGGGHVP
jgi:hypothetical protein